MDQILIATYNVKGISNGSIIEMINYLSSQTVVGLDIETSESNVQFDLDPRLPLVSEYKGGLDPYLSRIVMLQLGTLERVYIVDVRCYSIKELEPLIDFLDRNNNVTFVGVYLKFESKHLAYNYNIELTNIHDCYIVDKILYNGTLGRTYSLAGMSAKYLNLKPNNIQKLFEKYPVPTVNDKFLESMDGLNSHSKDGETFFIDKSTRMEFVTIGDTPFTHKQILYGSDDIEFPLLIMERQLKGRKLVTNDGKIELYYPTELIKIENYFSCVLATMELNGLPFNVDMWMEVYNSNVRKYEEYLTKLNQYVIKYYPERASLTLFSPDPVCTIDWSVFNDVASLFRAEGILPKAWSKKKKREVETLGSDELLKLVSNETKKNYMKGIWVDSTEKSNDFLILAFLMVGKMKKATTTYGVEFLKFVHPITGRIHTNFQQLVNSGRQSSRSPNLQNIPATKEFRDCFTPVGNPIETIMVDDNEVRVKMCGRVLTDMGLMKPKDLELGTTIYY